MRPGIPILLLLIALLAGCGSQGSSATGTGQPAGSLQGGQSTPTPPPAGAGGSVAHLEVLGGKLAGTYDSTGKKADCNWESNGSGADFVNIDATQGLNGLSFVSSEGGSNPGKFFFQALFAPFSLRQDTLEIDTSNPTKVLGSGKAQLDDKGATIRWTVDGMTADGTKMKGYIECGPVDRR